MACRSAAAYEGAAARGMTCEGAAARGTKHARWRNFTILYARADKTRLLARYDYFVPSDRVFGSFSVH